MVLKCTASTSLWLTDITESIGKKLPRYPLLPDVRMGRLAVNQDFVGLGLGGALLADALAHTLRSEIAAYTLVVDAKDDSAAAFYQYHGMIAFPNQPLTLFLPFVTASRITVTRTPECDQREMPYPAGFSKHHPTSELG